MAITGVSNYNSVYENTYASSRKEAAKKEETKQAATSISRTNESKLSSKAQDFLKGLRSRYGDYDFLIGNSTDDLKALAKSGTKEFSVIFSNAELEKMSAKQREHIEKGREEKRAGKKEEEIYNYSKSNAATKRTTVQADSMEELIEKITAVDWDEVKSEEMPESGGKFDYSI